MSVTGSTKKLVLISKCCYIGTGLTICETYYVNMCEGGTYAHFLDDEGNDRMISMLCFREPSYFN
jgi:hypothetical protein